VVTRIKGGTWIVGNEAMGSSSAFDNSSIERIVASHDLQDELGNEGLIPAHILPQYLMQDAFGELFSEDGLLVLGRGLGWITLLSCFIRYYSSDTSVNEDPPPDKVDRPAPPNRVVASSRARRRPVVLVVGLSRESERNVVFSLLSYWNTPAEELPVLITNESGSSVERSAMYKREQGGVFIVTSRILIVDLLSNVLNVNDVDGILVAHGEQVTENSTEAFILRIFRSQKTPYGSGFIKAVSSHPEQLLSGFAKVDKILKALHVRNLYLYPRFHDAIRQELEHEKKADLSKQEVIDVDDGRNHDRGTVAENEVAPGPQMGTRPRTAQPIEVIELHQSLTPLQQEIQQAIVVAIQTCVKELKHKTKQLSATSAIWKNHDDLKSISNCVTSYFDLAIKQQLEQDWYRVSPTSKQLIQDIRTLRTLFTSLLTYDCIAFWKLLISIKTMSAAPSSYNRIPSMWLLSSAGDLLFRRAKERVYRILDASSSGRTGDMGRMPKLHAVLEENPKWKLLQQVLDEIRQQAEDKCTARNNPTVLVMVQEERTLDTLRTYLTSGKEYTLLVRWLRYLEQYNDRSRSKISSSIPAKTNGSTLGKPAATAYTSLPDESRLLLEEETRVRRILFGKNNRNPRRNMTTDTSREIEKLLASERGDAELLRMGEVVVSSPQSIESTSRGSRKLNEIPNSVRKRRRVAKELGRGESMLQQDDLEQTAILDDALESAAELNEVPSTRKRTRSSKKATKSSDRSAAKADRTLYDQYDACFAVRDTSKELRILFRTYASTEADEASLLLLELRPDFVVLYDADIAFVRHVEVYASLTRSGSDPLKVYFLMFEASAEEKQFATSLEKEQAAFERLIHHKKTMPPPTLQIQATQEVQQAMTQGVIGGTYMDGALPLAFDTRRGRGRVNASKERRNIAVDVREFRSALPSILHQHGMRLAPITLTVGDYVLSTVHCVERKSISDLFGSFSSGRLFSQCEAMRKYYKCPCLLIEFDPEKTFCLHSSSELGGEIRTDSVCSKMAMLTMHFPELRILWSRSPQESLRIFCELKTNHEEVDVEKAIEIGRNESADSLLPVAANGNEENGDDMEEVNEVARDMLLRLPGVNIHSARKILEEVDSLAALIELSREELRRIVGPVAGQKLFTFFHQKLAST
jgi:DNA excision repair protein ERCC-4